MHTLIIFRRLIIRFGRSYHDVEKGAFSIEYLIKTRVENEHGRETALTEPRRQPESFVLTHASLSFTPLDLDLDL